jgi:hypothetical protein
MSDALEDLEQLVDELPDAVDRRRLGDRLNQSMETLRQADYQVARLKSVIELAEITGMAAAGQGQIIRKLQEEAFETGDFFEVAETDDDLRDADYEYKGLLRTLASSEQAIRTHWSVSASHRFKPLVALGELLQRIGVEPELGQRLAETGNRALKASQIGQAEALCAEVRDLLEEQQKLQAEQAGRLSDGEIGGFITALAEHRATLAMVTPEVQAWLSENQALERFTIVPRLQGNAGASAG